MRLASRAADLVGRLGRLGSTPLGAIRRRERQGTASSARDQATLEEHRRSNAAAAVVFIHGFGSRAYPFGRFPDLLAAQPALDGWDLYSLSYSTGFLPDFRGVWSSDPSIDLLARYLGSRTRLDPLGKYGALAFVAHSMGGLVVQQALVGDSELADRVSHVFCFGTPSAGAPAAGWSGFLKQQVADMTEDGAFIRELRRRWDEQFGEARPFDLWMVAGDRDAFIPATSSLDPFPPETQLVVPGDHLQIVDIQEAGSMSEQVVSEGLVGDAAPAGPWNSARVAVERHEFDRAVRELLPHAGELDERHLVDLALALEGTGRREEAIAVLREQAGEHGTDAAGALAGRLKRMWLAEGRRSDAESALGLYSEALTAAEATGEDEQAYYHAINVAFMELAHHGDREAATRAARRALEHCEVAPESFWRAATEGEAHLHLDDPDVALEAYRRAVGMEPAPSALESAYLQATVVAAKLGRSGVATRLETVIRPGVPGPVA